MPQRLPRLLLATLAGVLACGIPLWPIPYREVTLPGNPAPSTWLLLGALAGAVAALLLRPGLRAAILTVTLGFILAVMGRVAVETSRDPTSHNLWPFEVVIAGGIGLVAAILGAGLIRLGERFAVKQAG